MIAREILFTEKEYNCFVIIMSSHFNLSWFGDSSMLKVFSFVRRLSYLFT